MTPPDYQHLLENRMTDIETFTKTLDTHVGYWQKEANAQRSTLRSSRLFFAIAGLVLCVSFVVFGLHQANQIRKLEGEIGHFHAIEEVFWRNNETLYMHENSIYQHDKRIRSLEMKLRQHGIGDLPVRTGDTLPPKEEK